MTIRCLAVTCGGSGDAENAEMENAGQENADPNLAGVENARLKNRISFSFSFSAEVVVLFAVWALTWFYVCSDILH